MSSLCAAGQSERPSLLVRQLGLRDYCTTWRAMQAFTRERDAGTADELWLVEHPRVFTQGQAGKDCHLLEAGDIPVVHVDRGGQVTYHGPGQQVVYVLLNLHRRKLGVRALVSCLEQAIIDTLAEWSIDALARADAPGVYVQDAKIAALGLRVSRGCSFHGLALNVDMDLAPFGRINPCGHAGMAVTRMVDQGAVVGTREVSEALVRHLADQLPSSVQRADTLQPPCIEPVSHPLQTM